MGAGKGKTKRTQTKTKQAQTPIPATTNEQSWKRFIENHGLQNQTISNYYQVTPHRTKTTLHPKRSPPSNPRPLPRLHRHRRTNTTIKANQRRLQTSTTPNATTTRATRTRNNHNRLPNQPRRTLHELPRKMDTMK